MREVLGSVGLGFTLGDVVLLSNPGGIGDTTVFLNVLYREGNKQGAALWLDENEIDKLILLLSDAKRKRQSLLPQAHAKSA